MPFIIPGKEYANKICIKLKDKIKDLPRKPKLAVILVGERPDSVAYVNAKQKKCREIGIESILKKFPPNVSQNFLIANIQLLNVQDDIDAILVQLPLPEHLDTNLILHTVEPLKDVDGFHLENVGALVNQLNPICQPCTPKGVMRMLEIMEVELEGTDIVIIGASRVVGIPLFHMLLQKNATVTLCHKYTKNIKDIARRAEILISACGQAQMIKSDWVRQNAIVIDIGINSIPDFSRKSGKRLVGDVDFEDVKDKTQGITPVPGGVGPMTIAMLMENTYELCVSRI